MDLEWCPVQCCVRLDNDNDEDNDPVRYPESGITPRRSTEGCHRISFFNLQISTIGLSSYTTFSRNMHQCKVIKMGHHRKQQCYVLDLVHFIPKMDNPASASAFVWLGGQKSKNIYGRELRIFWMKKSPVLLQVLPGFVWFTLFISLINFSFLKFKSVAVSHVSFSFL